MCDTVEGDAVGVYVGERVLWEDVEAELTGIAEAGSTYGTPTGWTSGGAKGGRSGWGAYCGMPTPIGCCGYAPGIGWTGWPTYACCCEPG